MKTEFPFFENNPGVVYLDSAATTLKPYHVIDAMDRYYRTSGLSVHRSSYPDATEQIEQVRSMLEKFLTCEVVFTSGATESLNMIAAGLDLTEPVFMSPMEHNSCRVPFINNGAKIIDTPAGYQVLKGISVMTQVSNVTGIWNRAPVNNVGIRVVDATQAIAHMLPINYHLTAFSGHKMYGPTGIGVLAGHLSLLKPTKVGSQMATNVHRGTFDYSERPLEAGTPNIAGIIGLGAAVEFLQSLPPKGYRLIDYVKEELQKIPSIEVLPGGDISILSFVAPGFSCYDIADQLAEKKIYVRAGKHCADYYLETLGLEATVRVSLGVYNDEEDIDKLVKGLKDVL